MTIHTAAPGGNMSQQNLAPFGMWSSVQTYNIGDMVVSSSGAWKSLVNSNRGNNPAETAFWTKEIGGAGGGLTSTGAVTSLTGTANQIIVTTSIGNVTASLSTTLIAPGTFAITTISGTPDTFAAFNASGVLVAGSSYSAPSGVTGGGTAGILPVFTTTGAIGNSIVTQVTTSGISMPGQLTVGSLTSGRITFIGASGLLKDDATLTYSTSLFTQRIGTSANSDGILGLGGRGDGTVATQIYHVGGGAVFECVDGALTVATKANAAMSLNTNNTSRFYIEGSGQIQIPSITTTNPGVLGALWVTTSGVMMRSTGP